MNQGTFRSTLAKLSALLPFVLFFLLSAPSAHSQSQPKPFQLMETSIEEIHAAFKSGQLTSSQLVQLYLDRIEAYDKKGPAINAIITLNPKALEDAAKLDAAVPSRVTRSVFTLLKNMQCGNRSRHI